MTYTKTNWTDRIVDKPLTYTQQTNADGTITLIPAEGTIVQSGTPITAAALNNLETQYDSAMADVAAGYMDKHATGLIWGYAESTSYNAGYMGFPIQQWNKEGDNTVYGWQDNTRIKILKAGLYRVDLQMARSDLPAGQTWWIGSCKNDDQAQQWTTQVKQGDTGWNAASGPNNTFFVLTHWHYYRCVVNDYLFFSQYSDDGPRNYNQLRYSIMRVSD
jgi:hypothetical protein